MVQLYLKAALHWLHRCFLLCVSEGQSLHPSNQQPAPSKSLHSDEMRNKENTAVLNPNSSEAVSEGRSRTPTTESLDSGHSAEEVYQVAMDIERMSIKDPKEPRQTNQAPCTYRGLNNLGATCYLNATLQVLFMTKVFRESVLQRDSSDTNDGLVSALKNIFQELSNQDRGALSVSTRGIIKSLCIQYVYEQQDAVEYFLDILEKVGTTFSKVFSGTLRNIRICSKQHESDDYSPFKSLQIPVNPRDGLYTLEDGIDKYFESTTLVKEDQMYCDGCQKKRDTKLSCEIHEYPTILPLHLKRFVYDYRRGFVKNDCPMDVPLDLPVQKHKYSLYAVINHTGSRFGGHYTAVIRSDDKWYHFDDSRVTMTDVSKLKRSREAYLLLYQKTSSDTGEEDRKEIPKPAEPREADQTECGEAYDKLQLEVSAPTEQLRILVWSIPETKSVKVELSIGSPESQLWISEMCSSGPPMVLFVDPLKFKNKDFIPIPFEEIYRFLRNNSREFPKIAFTSKGHPKKKHIKKAMRNYASIENNRVLDIGADLFVQVNEFVTKLLKAVDQDHELDKPIHVMKPQKRKHEKTEATHEKRASKKNRHQIKRKDRNVPKN